jgi:hypothetical protein
MRQIVTACVAVTVLIAAAAAVAGGELEVLQLRHRGAAEVVETLRPLIEEGGSISGMGDKILVRASAGNRAELRKALAAIDTAPRRLTITVIQDNQAGGEGSGAGTPLGRVWSSRGSAADRSDQRVQVIEGGSAFIRLGYSLPIPLRQVAVGPLGAAVSETIVYRDIGTGFYAQPRLNGDRVTLEISPRQESFSATDAAAVRFARLGTTVSGRLGEWMELGAANQALSAERSGVARYSTRGSLEARRVLLKVEETP